MPGCNVLLEQMKIFRHRSILVHAGASSPCGCPACVADAQLPSEHMLQVRVAHFREERANCLLTVCLRLSCSFDTCCRCAWHSFGRASPSPRPPSWRSTRAGLTSWLSSLSSPPASTGKWQAGAAQPGRSHKLALVSEQLTMLLQASGRQALWGKHMQPDRSRSGCATCLRSTAGMLELQHSSKTACSPLLQPWVWN